MLKINRPASPQKLATGAGIATQKLWDKWKKRKNWKKDDKLVIRRSIYGASIIKSALRNAQSLKCAYCETPLPRSHGAVEHFRPKEGWRQKRKDKLKSPGYFWLSYEWSNLLFSCDICNDNGHKNNLFPLDNPSGRAKHSKPDVTAEIPLLLNPYVDDPDQHIKWHFEVPSGITKRGIVTIDVLGLAKDVGLIEDRRDYLAAVLVDLEIAETRSLPLAKQALLIARLRFKATADAPYSAMIRANYRSRINAL